ncbi:MAG: universal stress protein [Flavobacteriales bacterium]|nr:universal stress protein [Flavobacteriales bacterium]
MARILLPTDFSEAALNASKFAFDLFGTTGNKFTLVHTFLKPSFDNALLLASVISRSVKRSTG